jgi:hypothetical protein
VKKILSIVLCFVSLITIGYGQSITPNVGLQIPAAGSNNWNLPLNYNFNVIDQLFGGIRTIPQLKATTVCIGADCRTSWPVSGTGINQLTGDGTAGPGTGSQVFTLSNTAVTPGSYTNASLTVDGKGRVTSASNGILTLQIATTFVGVLANNQIILYAPASLAATVPSSCTGSHMTALVAATGSTAILFKNLTTATTLCTATFSASGTTATFTGAGGSISIGDQLEIIGPSTADATLATVGATIYATR